MNKVVPFLWGLLLASSSVWAGAFVRDFNPTTRYLTIFTPQPGMFKSGSRVFLYKANRLVGEAVVLKIFHSKVLGKLVSGKKISRNLEVKKLKRLYKTKKVASLNTISYKDLSSQSRSFLVKVSYIYDNNVVEKQKRKIILPSLLPVLLPGKKFYAQVETKTISRFSFLWHKNRMRGIGLTIQKKELITKQILAVSIIERLKPPEAWREKKLRALVDVEESKNVKKPIATVKLILKLSNPKNIFEGGKYHQIKIYSNSLFIDEFQVDKMPISEYHLSSNHEFHPGENVLEFYLVEAEKVKGVLLEKKAKRIGEKKIYFSDSTYRHTFTLSDSSGKLRLAE